MSKKESIIHPNYTDDPDSVIHPNFTEDPDSVIHPNFADDPDIPDDGFDDIHEEHGGDEHYHEEHGGEVQDPHGQVKPCCHEVHFLPLSLFLPCNAWQ